MSEHGPSAGGANSTRFAPYVHPERAQVPAQNGRDQAAALRHLPQRNRWPRIGMAFAFFCATTEQEVASNFARGVPISVLFEVAYIGGCPGVDISELCVYPGRVPGQKEVLFPPPAQDVTASSGVRWRRRRRGGRVAVWVGGGGVASCVLRPHGHAHVRVRLCLCVALLWARARARGARDANGGACAWRFEP